MSSLPGTTANTGAAFAHVGDAEWSIGNDRVNMTFRADAGRRLHLTEFLLVGADSWRGTVDALPFALVLDGVGLNPADVRVEGSRAWSEGSAARLKIRLAGPDGPVVALQLECHAGQSLVRQWLDVTPANIATVDRVEPARLSLAGSGLDTAHTVSGLQHNAGGRADDGPYRSFRLEHASLDVPLHQESGIRSTLEQTPWLVLTGAGAGVSGGIVLALEYGGRRELDAALAEDTVSAAFAPVGLVPTVAAGDTWTSPATWVGAFAGDLDDAAAVLHRYLRERVLPATDDHFPWVQYNTWFSFYCDLDADTLLAEAEIAADLGIEVFYVDAGWWVGNPYRGEHFSSGLGNWTENRDKFPDGLKAFADGIRARGMHFGLWVEPERVDLRTVTTGTWRPEWIARESEDRYVRCDWSWARDTETVWLCFGNPEVQEWATAWIGDLVDELGIRWLKWDSNFWGVCTSADHGHGVGDAEAAQLAGVRLVMARLRERFPDLVIENCGGGGSRMDYVMASQTPVAWLNDVSQPAHRSRFHTSGASYLYPPETLNAWVREAERENVNGQELPDPTWRMLIRSRMLSALGFSNQLQTWSERTRAIAREEIARYREEVRPILKGGAFYHLLPQPDLGAFSMATPDAWEAYQVAAADGSRHVVLGFRNLCPNEVVVHPRAIDAAAQYEVAVDGQDPATVAGADLVAHGLLLECPPLASAWVAIRRLDAGAGA